jgi:hypothetical protein
MATRSQLHRAWKDAQAKVRVCRHSIREKGEELAEAQGDLAIAISAETQALEALSIHDDDSLKPKEA